MTGCALVVAVVAVVMAVSQALPYAGFPHMFGGQTYGGPGRGVLGYPQLGGMQGSAYGYGPQQQQQQQRQRPLLTCISMNTQDPNQQLRFTIRGDRDRDNNGYEFDNDDFGFGRGLPGMGMGLGFGSFGNNDNNDNDDNEARDWIVEGIITPGQMPQQGSYYAVVTRFGRTVGGQCSAEALGPAVQARYANNGGSMGAMGAMGAYAFPGAFPGHGGHGMHALGLMGRMKGLGFGGMGMGVGMYSPYMQYKQPYYHQQQQQQQKQMPAGVLSNPVIMASGVSHYTARLSGLTFNQINGGAIALCQDVNQGRCMGRIPMCCSITRDQAPATQTFIGGDDLDNDFDDDFLRGGHAVVGNFGAQGGIANFGAQAGVGSFPTQGNFGAQAGVGNFGGQSQIPFGAQGGSVGLFDNDDS